MGRLTSQDQTYWQFLCEEGRYVRTPFCVEIRSATEDLRWKKGAPLPPLPKLRREAGPVVLVMTREEEEPTKDDASEQEESKRQEEGRTQISWVNIVANWCCGWAVPQKRD